MASFGRRRASSIGDSIARTKPVRYSASDVLEAFAPQGGDEATEQGAGPQGQPADAMPRKQEFGGQRQVSGRLEQIRAQVAPLLMEQIDIESAARLSPQDLAREVNPIVTELLYQLKLTLNHAEQTQLETMLLDEMVGLGPLEPLLKRDDVNDILVNGAGQIYIETKGKLQLSEARFRDNEHVMQVATRIVAAVGRRIDQTTPLADARLADGSRVNVVAPPLSLKGPAISIRKFSRSAISLKQMARQGNLSPELAKVLEIAAACRLNIIISGGTGSGKTTMMNAMSELIDHEERIVTIEDAAELQLQQPHVVPLETRVANLEGKGEITIRDLVKNALRMRPDRIIVGEVRGSEAVDMLQAMNTGHDGSMATLHANNPREALTRLENMVNMANLNLPYSAIRRQIADSVNLIIQVNRMRDGKRRVVAVSEVAGMEGDVITTQDLFTFRFTGEDDHGNLLGAFVSSGLRPHFTPRAEYFGLDKALSAAMQAAKTESLA
jgi:pilus assembly protein CpaF